jgi:hypothetical protein
VLIQQLTKKINMAAQVVIVGYKPKPGKAEGLVTDGPSIIMGAADGTIIEVFEWLSAEAIQSAHGNPAVQQMWGEYAEVCDYVPVGSVAEAGKFVFGF